MLIVIMIISILFVAFRSSFQIKNKDILYAQACIETIYGEVNNFLHGAISSKSMNSWGIQIFPDRYNIAFRPAQQHIELGYEQPGNLYSLYSSISISGNTSNYCNSNNYVIIMSGNSYEISINKWVQENENLQFFMLSWISITGENTFRKCNPQLIDCKKMARFESDTRTLSLKKQMCLTYTGNDCLEWDN